MTAPEPEPIVNRWVLEITASAEVVKAEDIAKQQTPEGDE